MISASLSIISTSVEGTSAFASFPISSMIPAASAVVTSSPVSITPSVWPFSSIVSFGTVSSSITGAASSIWLATISSSAATSASSSTGASSAATSSVFAGYTSDTISSSITGGISSAATGSTTSASMTGGKDSDVAATGSSAATSSLLGVLATSSIGLFATLFYIVFSFSIMPFI